MKTLTTATALAAIFAASPLAAQETTTTPATDMPAAEAAPAPADGTMQEGTTADPMMPAGADTAETGTEPMMDPDAAGGMSGETFMTAQDVGQHLASELIGATLWSQNDENIGEIGDIVLDDDGKISAVVVSVGGFLGMGEKDVAVNWSMITPVSSQEAAAIEDQDEIAEGEAMDAEDLADNAADLDEEPSWDVSYLVVETSREALEAAPEFVYLEEQMDDVGNADGAANDAEEAGEVTTAPAEAQ